MSTMRQGLQGDKRDEVAIARMVKVLREATCDMGSFEQLEASVLSLTNEACRRCLQQRLQQDADDLEDELLVDGVQYRAHQPGRVTYHSLCGPLSIVRSTYREVGVRNGPTLVPIELQMGVIERCTPAMAFGISRGYADLPMRDYEAHLRAAHRRPPSRSTLERVARRLGTAIHEQHARFESKVRRKERVPTSAVAINIGLDRTTIPMEEDAEEGIEVRLLVRRLRRFLRDFVELSHGVCGNVFAHQSRQRSAADAPLRGSCS